MVRLNALCERAKAQGMPAVAVTDLGNLFGMVKFYRAAMQQGVQPIIGCELRFGQDAAHEHRLVLLCQTLIGYQNLTRIISRAYLEGQHAGVARARANWLTSENTQGLIALSGGQHGSIAQALIAGHADQALTKAQYLAQLFDDRFYLQITRCGHPAEAGYVEPMIALAAKAGLPLVATADVCFLEESDFPAHEARVCVYQGETLDDPNRPRRHQRGQSFKTAEQMTKLFADVPEALKNTVEIAKRCHFLPELGKTALPAFPVPEGMTEAEFFNASAHEGLQARFQQRDQNGQLLMPVDQQSVYLERLAEELGIIESMGFSGYFLIVADFVRWSKDNDVPVGPGRGSGAGSLVAYALGITDMDPIVHELLFERFLNPERVSMPDFDIDFCMDGRDRVIEYVSEKYGRDSVSQIITYGTMAARAVIRDVGRVLGHPYGFVDALAKLVPFELGMTLEQAMRDEVQLQERYQEEPEVKHLYDLACSLEGIVRNIGKHAGGVVIAPSALTDFSPLYCEEDGSGLITQFDKDDIEAMGLVKFDFLGLRTLTIINQAEKLINAKSDQPINTETLLLEDAATFELLKSGHTSAVFQLESRVMKDWIRRLQPDCFEEIVALVALVRPGPLQSGMADEFVDRKHGRVAISTLHPSIEQILKPTYGVILYQEQVMQIAQQLAGFSLGTADLLRRAMGKKKPEEMAKQRTHFLEGAAANDVDKHLANQIFDIIDKFAGYGFNKSHSVAYAALSYRTAWLKAHYPAEFMASVLSSDMDNTDKIVVMIAECQRMGLIIKPPSVQYSQMRFSVSDRGEIVYGLGAVKGIGTSLSQAVVDAREAGGAFKDCFEFCERMTVHKPNRRMLEALIKSGAMDALLDGDRARGMANIEAVLRHADQAQQAKQSGQRSLFGDHARSSVTPALINVEPWRRARRLSAELESLGLYLSGHPMEAIADEMSSAGGIGLDQLARYQDQAVIAAGLVSSLRTMMTRSGQRMAFVVLEDQTNRVELSVFAKIYADCRSLIKKSEMIVIEADVQADEYSQSHKLVARKVYDLNSFRSSRAKALRLKIANREDRTAVAQLADAIRPFRGGNLPIEFIYMNEDASAIYTADASWNIRPTQAMLEVIERLEGVEAQFCYGSSH